MSINSPILQAKPITIKWSEVKGATQYEVEITQNGKEIILQKLPKTAFETSLDPGAYAYRIRAIDKLRRGGRWSVGKNLIVTAPAPQLESGETPEIIEHKGVFPGVSIKWKNVDFVKLYQIEVKNKVTGESVYKKEITGTKVKIDQLPVGQFEYSVSSLIEAGYKKIGSKVVKPVSLIVSENRNSPTVAESKPKEKPKVEQPIGLEPYGYISMSEDSNIRLAWKNVKGADKYEVSLEPIDGRSIASGTRERTWTVDKNELEVPISKLSHKYRWKVRAIASNGDQSATSELEFSPVPDQGVGKVGEGAIQIGANNMQFSGRLEGPRTNGGGSSTGMGWGFNVKGEYWLSKNIGVEGFYESLTFNTQNSNFSLNIFGLMAKTRWRFSQSVSAWKFYFKSGFGSGTFFKPNSSLIPYYGIVSEIGAIKPLSEDFDLDLGVLYFRPLASSDGSSIARYWESGVLRPHLEITHHLSPKISAALGVRYDLRQIFSGNGTNPDRFLGNSAAIDVSVKYKFGDMNSFNVSERLSEGTRKIANINTTELDPVTRDPLKANHGVLEIAGGVMPMTTTTVSTPAGLPTTTNQANGISFRNGVRGEYWLGRYTGVSFDLESSYYLHNLSDRTAIEMGVALNQRYYLNVLGGLILIGKLGAAQKSYLQINNDGTTDVRSVIGPTVELEIRKLLNKTMLSVSGQYQYPSMGVVRAKVFHPIYKSLEFGIESFWESQRVTQSSTVSISRQNYGTLGLLRYRFGVTY
ncbi:MAG: hypothetical protein KA715_02250 [Xanthomonadaceae bacterium]|nr:hypothetical protein [Xanthomonadaceae bacterium]